MFTNYVFEVDLGPTTTWILLSSMKSYTKENVKNVKNVKKLEMVQRRAAGYVLSRFNERPESNINLKTEIEWNELISVSFWPYRLSSHLPCLCECVRLTAKKC